MKIVKTRTTHYCNSDECKRRDPKFPDVAVEINVGEKAKMFKQQETRFNTYWETYYFHLECPPITGGYEF